MSFLEDVDILIRNCTIVTMDAKQPVIERGFIAEKNRKIVNIGKKTSVPSSIKAKKTINAMGKVALPGLVNCHTHVPMPCFVE